MPTNAGYHLRYLQDTSSFPAVAIAPYLASATAGLFSFLPVNWLLTSLGRWVFIHQFFGSPATSDDRNMDYVFAKCSKSSGMAFEYRPSRAFMSQTFARYLLSRLAPSAAIGNLQIASRYPLPDYPMYGRAGCNAPIDAQGVKAYYQPSRPGIISRSGEVYKPQAKPTELQYFTSSRSDTLYSDAW